jgi:hypothetical protein
MGLTALATASRAGEPARQMVPAIWAAGEVGRGPREPVELGDDERLRLAAPQPLQGGHAEPVGALLGGRDAAVGQRRHGPSGANRAGPLRRRGSAVNSVGLSVERPVR